MDDNLMMDLTNEDVMRGKYLTFKVENGEYGIEISYITEIIGVQDITPVPNTHMYVKGIINLRGTIVPIIDMRLRFGVQEMEYTDRTCIIVLSMGDMNIGLIVDEVQEVSDIVDSSLQAPPQAQSNMADNKFVKSIGMVGASVKQLLDINKVFEVVEAVAV